MLNDFSEINLIRIFNKSINGVKSGKIGQYWVKTIFSFRKEVIIEICQKSKLK